MIILKTSREIESMRKAGKILHDALQLGASSIKPGMTTLQLNDMIDTFILKSGGQPGFKTVKGYTWATCICVNEQVVHTPPSDRIIQTGDVVTIDAGVCIDGLHTDAALTVEVATKTPKVQTFLETGRITVEKAIKKAVAGGKVSDISQVLQSGIEGAGYSIIRELTGHGVGRSLHEDPYVPCFYEQGRRSTELKPGMTLAIEVMYSMGGAKIVTERDGWSIKMADSSIAGMFEHTVAILENRTLILT